MIGTVPTCKVTPVNIKKASVKARYHMKRALRVDRLGEHVWSVSGHLIHVPSLVS